MLPQPVGLLKLVPSLFCTSSVEGRDTLPTKHYKVYVNIFLRLNACKRICFKLGMMLNTTELYSLLPI